MPGPSAIIRPMVNQGDAERDRGLATPADVERFDDIAYGPEEAWQLLDIYRPKGASGALPVIVSVHGGAWVASDKGHYQFYCMSLAQRGFAVVNFTYRLAPEHKFPAAVQDTSAVFAWVCEHAGEYGLDADHVFAVADSAGAHACALFCEACGDEGFARDLGLAGMSDLMPRAVALSCGAYAPKPVYAIPHMDAILAELLEGAGTPDELGRIDAIAHAGESFPSAFLYTADGDYLQADTLALAARLRELSVWHELHVYAGRPEQLEHVFQLDIRHPQATRANDEVCAFFRRFVAASPNS